MTHSFESCPELPAPPRRIAFFSIVALTLGIGLAYWVERPRGPVCQGTLMARTTYISSPADGKLAELLVEEGASIEMDQPLVRIVDDTLEQAVVTKTREIDALEFQHRQALAAAELELAWRQRALDSEICEIQLQSATFLKEKYNFEMQQSMLNDILAGQELVMADNDSSFVSSLIVEGATKPSDRMATILEMELASNAAEVSSAQVEICDLRQKQLEQLRHALPAQVRRTEGVDVAEANLKRARAELDQLRAQQESLTVLSPSIGRVGVYQNRVGSRVTEGAPIVELLDDAHRYLLVNVPSTEIVSFPIDQKLLLIFPGNQHRFGKVTLIAPQAQHCSLLNQSAIQVQVEQVGKMWPNVPIGSQVEVQIDR
ncbi:hypothetical protein AB1L42_15840 [Thalassoglobus sp. JC818]|uniref:HlyD family secretion protein n=1 Tax=Thalassoglobus sp. JC818 TaxID=3232136 RepID=UPI0034579F12